MDNKQPHCHHLVVICAYCDGGILVVVPVVLLSSGDAGCQIIIGSHSLAIQSLTDNEIQLVKQETNEKELRAQMTVIIWAHMCPKGAVCGQWWLFLA
jgi:hypothetical protein